jgi:hypothetical protein
MEPIHESSIGYPAVLDILRKKPLHENTQPINMLYGGTILFEDRTANYGLDEFVERVKQLKEKLTDKLQQKKPKTQRSIIVIAEDEGDPPPVKTSSANSSHKNTHRTHRNKPTTTSQKTQKTHKSSFVK